MSYFGYLLACLPRQMDGAMTNDTSVSTNLLGRTVAWYGDRGREGGTVVAVTFWQGGFVLLIATDEGLRQKTASGCRVE